MADPAEMVTDLLVAAGVGAAGASSGWGIFTGYMPDAPDSAISSQIGGGVNPNPKWLLDEPSVQVLIRGDRNAYQATYVKAKEVKDALLGLPAQVVLGDRIDGITMQGDIIPLGRDEDFRTNFSLNFSLIIEPASGTHRSPL